jgi:hypothetical protein
MVTEMETEAEAAAAVTTRTTEMVEMVKGVAEMALIRHWHPLHA